MTEKLRTEANTWASSQYMGFNDEDPRAVAARAEMAYRRSPEGHFEAVANPTGLAQRKMEKGVEYSVRA